MNLETLEQKVQDALIAGKIAWELNNQMGTRLMQALKAIEEASQELRSARAKA